MSYKREINRVEPTVNKSALEKLFPELFGNTPNFLNNLVEIASDLRFEQLDNAITRATLHFRYGLPYYNTAEISYRDTRRTPDQSGFVKATVRLASEGKRWFNWTSDENLELIWRDNWEDNPQRPALQMKFRSENDENYSEKTKLSVYPAEDRFHIESERQNTNKSSDFTGRLSTGSQDLKEKLISMEGRYIDSVYMAGNMLTVFAPLYPKQILSLAMLTPEIFTLPVQLKQLPSKRTEIDYNKIY